MRTISLSFPEMSRRHSQYADVCMQVNKKQTRHESLLILAPFVPVVFVDQ